MRRNDPVHAATLHYFTSVVECGSIRKAGERLSISASTVDRQILRLEEHLQTDLFERTGNGMIPTAAGTRVYRRVYRHFERTLREFGALQSEIRSRSGLVAGDVRVVVMDSLAFDFVPDLVGSFRAQHPDVGVEVQCRMADEAIEAVRSGDADIAVAFEPRRSEHVRVVARVRTPMCAMVRPDHPIAGHRRVGLDECARYDLLVHAGPVRIERYFGARFGQFRRAHPGVVRTDSLVLAKELVRRGAGVALYTRLGFLREIGDGTIVAIEVHDDDTRRLCTAVMRTRNARWKRAVDAMEAVLQEGMEGLARRLGGPGGDSGSAGCAGAGG